MFIHFSNNIHGGPGRGHLSAGQSLPVLMERIVSLILLTVLRACLLLPSKQGAETLNGEGLQVCKQGGWDGTQVCKEWEAGIPGSDFSVVLQCLGSRCALRLKLIHVTCLPLVTAVAFLPMWKHFLALERDRLRINARPVTRAQFLLSKMTCLAMCDAFSTWL